MKNLSLLFVTIFLFHSVTLSQEIITNQNDEPFTFYIKSHDPTLKELPAKSFYESKSDWQYIIDTTWGPGLPLEQKQLIFNTFRLELEDEFDGFLSLGFTPGTWQTYWESYYNKINSSTSRGRFSAILNYFTLYVKDFHTRAWDDIVQSTPKIPGIPYLHLTGGSNWNHAGAIVTVLPDSTIVVLRTADNYPLDIEPGDVILGYNGVSWADLLDELMTAELPNPGISGGSESSFTHGLFVGSIMNWHLFDTIDVLKYSTGDTLQLDVSPLASFNAPSMRNNEQIAIPGVEFPDFYNDEFVTYGIIDNTNIGYIYIFDHHQTTLTNQKMYEAIDSLKNTDALIIDMRYTLGGWALWDDAFGILTNETLETLQYAERCNPSSWSLCFTGYTYPIIGEPPEKYERPIALLTGPFCLSMGDINAYRLKELENVRSFGRSTIASMGSNNEITQFNDFTILYSIGDQASVYDTSVFLNRKEFPVDYPVWHNRDDIAQGKDAVVEAALDWINSLVYGHDVSTDKHYCEVNDTINVSAIIENPNSHNITAKIYIENLETTFIDSIDLSQTESAELWQGEWFTPNIEDFYKLKIKSIDNNTGELFTFSNMERFTTAGLVVVDSATITYNPVPEIYQVKPHLRNKGNSFTVENLKITMMSNDTLITFISGPLNVTSIAPGETVIPPGSYTVRVDSNFSLPFNFNFNISSEEWLYWKDSISIVTSIEDENTLPVTYKLFQNYPNPFNPTTTIKYGIPEQTFVELRIYDILGREVELLVNEEEEAGYYDIEFDAKKLSSGIYLYQIKAGDFINTNKMILLK